MKKFALLVGNGFTLDCVTQFGLHSSFPLHNFNSRDINYNNFIHLLPDIQNELLNQEINDFNAIEDYIQRNKNDIHKECQLRRFLAMAYSHFQITVESYNMNDWKWVRWLKQNKKGLSCAISFNYDMVLERSLKVASVHYSRIGTNEPTIGIPILKPHGSIDFDIDRSNINIPWESLWNTATSLNDAGYVSVVPKFEWLLPRVEADIIPPSMHNYQKRLRWVKKMNSTYESKANELDALVIIGISYWDVDRQEIDFFLEKLPKTSTVYIMNPEPHPDLIKKLNSLGLSSKTFDFHELPW
ncbi:hypothetical protein COM97_18675 [Bacillus thuringiensis]|uniref:hypothetical protein n=1 Tax=Bacillus thuringiensis TaxID=1428 RepID=UPI000BED4CAA|nr:hypothetical protein [Bacillus thuringiensis]PEF04993.1 hypothetical protein COM97_18675 [Bacillus thuringiensis]